MTHAELELLAALFLLYAYECIFWLRADEQAHTRDGQGWRAHRLTHNSFTLLGRRAVPADPLLLHPGFLREPATEDRPLQRARIAEALDGLSLLVMQCRVQAALLLLVLPTLLLTHHLSAWWREFACLLLLSHALLCGWLWRALRRLAKSTHSRILGAVLLNPLGATRVLDVLAQALYEQQGNDRLWEQPG